MNQKLWLIVCGFLFVSIIISACSSSPVAEPRDSSAGKTSNNSTGSSTNNYTIGTTNYQIFSFTNSLGTNYSAFLFNTTNGSMISNWVTSNILITNLWRTVSNGFTNTTIPIFCITNDRFLTNLQSLTNCASCYTCSFLEAEYLFNGSANDTSGNNMNGTVTSAIFTMDRLGKTNSAYTLNGASDYIDVGNNAKLNPSNQITVCAWYKPTSSFSGSGSDPIVDKGYTSHVSPYYQYHMGVTGDLYIDSVNKAEFNFFVTINNISYSVKTASNFWSIGNWYFIVGLYDGTQVKLYVNGTLIQSIAATGLMTNYGKNVSIGKFSNLTNKLAGIVDNVRIYSRALTDAEIQDLYHEIN